MRGARPHAALEAIVADGVAVGRGDVLLAAVSGGPDSVALAALLHRAVRRAGASLVLGHVNHALRPTSWQDEAVVLALASTLGTRAMCVSLSPGSSAEARLRDERYAALGCIANAAGATRVFTAHHAEDQTETVLLALFRGAGPSGLAGMPFARPLVEGIELVRPLLTVGPLALRAYCAAEHLAFCVDPSNAQESYRRNAVRSGLATLRQSFPHLDSAVARCAAIVREERDGSSRAALRGALREELAASAGGAHDVTFERLDAAARAIERGGPGRHFLRRGVELVVE